MAQTTLTKLLDRSSDLRPSSSKWPLALSLRGLLGAAGAAWWYKQTYGLPKSLRIRDAASTDPGLLQKGTTFERYETPSGHVYPRIRTFYLEHSKANKLPQDIPLLVFMHGLGGSAAQFSALLTSLVNVAPCLAIDLPGCGRSDFEPNDDEAYTTLAFAELLYCAIDRYRKKDVNQKVILIGHSMGCTITTLLASSTSPLAHLCEDHISGVVAICPRSHPLTDKQLLQIQRLNWIWTPLFNLIRLVDRRGGVTSASVLRVVGKDADYETRKLQLRFNQQSKSAVFQKILRGLYLQEQKTKENGEESLLGKRIWSGLKVPLFLTAAENDTLQMPASSDQQQDEEVAPDQLGSAPPQTIDQANGSQVVKEESSTTKHSFVLKSEIFPAPSSHSLIYTTRDVRVLSSLIEAFLARHVDERLGQDWQLRHMTTSGKWDVKNYKKWQAIQPCSPPIAGIFRAMKTMREQDDVHSPREFVKRYGWQNVPGGATMVLDISHDTPVYNSQTLDDAGVEYHKFPTVSKQPPTEDEVEQFIDIVNQLRASPKIAGASDKVKPTIAVHCHYGFNRTGFFLVCYLIEKEGWKVEDALAEFAEKRAPGIKHDFFVNELFRRYAMKMERRGTIVG
ncbi:hypothetical protein M409DRAFT_21381 [Zasmidium cellare ATCC 36951]|uniref:Tyrosine specific protein phosphatases domain-containing protein n=1 Tax=Zasmidium cellare ATCC 36951 TaxID=1080233 RepID=A0A6A6CT40_ZASCE|nr:uncharacterized protein M409DRAFT_21381 [Zasmidium cellare ATCC 36951]KAF2168636.1 hypothetical protein M409DRAFT_21381 [Zasmidium cellare ATCC 36951]